MALCARYGAINEVDVEATCNIGGSDMAVDRQYVDSHGQSEVAFAFSYLLGFDLLPRLKAIARQRLYLPMAAVADQYLALAPVLTRACRRWQEYTGCSLHCARRQS